MIQASLSDKEIQKALREVRKYSENVQNKVRRIIHLTAYDVALDAKMNAPVKTNRLRSSIAVLKEDLPRFIAQSGSDVKYAPYVEFGTGALVDVPEGLEDYAMQFKGKGIRQVNLPARPYLFPAAEKNRKKFIDNIKKAMKDAAR